ncbi:glycosyltransferase [Allobacillus sp. GCM10007491]|uniref:Glycosyltransferase n=1 Tax=Allobacillus saliphilus TaxID=2912308 RepID=A0A941CYF7_9BACI|nr:glycosyltransferase [Allobacillus saliphilus]MBR7554748.1 glycosyltransferase [Allobacillus saliphilus]MBR7554925.1 glycosyltransferase [Allobacillus saliphilus]
MKKPITVVFFIYFLGSGGAGRTFLNILNNIDQDKFRPVLVTCNYEGSYEPFLNKNIKFIKLDTKRLRKSILPLAKIIRKERADIVFSTIPNYNVIAILARLLSYTRAKNVIREAAFLGGDRKTDTKLKVYGLFYRFSTKVIALSNGVKNNLIRRYGVNEKKLQVIYNPVDIISISEKMKENIELPYFTNGKKTIVTAGRLVEDKDQQTLIKSFALLATKIDAQLLILGEGPLEEKLKEQAMQLGIQDRVHLVGFQENPYAFFHQADLFVLTSKREGFGHVLAEALATGVPIVSTRCEPGATEVLENGKYAKLVPIGDTEELTKAMKDILLLQENEKNAIIEKGYERLSDFDVHKIVKQYEEVFKEAVK